MTPYQLPPPVSQVEHLEGHPGAPDILQSVMDAVRDLNLAKTALGKMMGLMVSLQTVPSELFGTTITYYVALEDAQKYCMARSRDCLRVVLAREAIGRCKHGGDMVVNVSRKARMSVASSWRIMPRSLKRLSLRRLISKEGGGGVCGEGVLPYVS